MHSSEIDSVLKTMTIIVDTREQDTAQSHRRFQAIGLPIIREKLSFGDYSAAVSLPDGSSFSLGDKVTVERKMSIDELAQCLTSGRDRFRREFERAEAVGGRVYLLIENASWDAVYDGRYATKVHPHALIASMAAWMARYDCRIVMVGERNSGKLIHDILIREMKERLCQIAKDG